MTASPSGSVSSDATSNPRNPSVSAISCAEAGTSTNSRSQETTSRMRDHEEQMQPRSHEATKKKSAWVSSCFRVFVVAFVLIRKLFQKPQVVFVKEPNVLDPVPQDRHALDADPPRESRVALRIVAHCLEHGRMHHPRPADLEPSGLLAHGAALAVALPAADVDFSARFGVRKETRTEPDS